MSLQANDWRTHTADGHAADRSYQTEPCTGTFGGLCGGGQPVLEAELRAVFYFISCFPLLFEFIIGGLGLKFCVSCPAE